MSSQVKASLPTFANNKVRTFATVSSKMKANLKTFANDDSTSLSKIIFSREGESSKCSLTVSYQLYKLSATTVHDPL